MVVEELIAKLGFKTTGMAEVKKFDGALAGIKNKVQGLGKIGSLSGAGSLAAFFKNGVSQAALMAGSIAKIGIGIVGLLGGVAAVTYGILRMSRAFISAAISAARMRRELQLTSVGQGTTAQNADKVSRIYQAIGLSASDATSDLAKFSEEVRKSVNEGGKGPEWLEKAGIKSVDKRGNRLDTSEVFTSLLLKVSNQARDLKIRRDFAEGNGAPGSAAKPGSAKLKKLNSDELNFNKLLESMGLDSKTIGAIKASGGSADVMRKAQQLMSLAPGRTDEQEARSKRIAENAAKLDLAMGTLAEVMGNAGSVIADQLLPPLVSTATALVEFGKWLGVISKTNSDVAAENKTKEDLANKRTEINRQTSSEAGDRNVVEAARKVSGWDDAFKEAAAVIQAATKVDSARAISAAGARKAAPEVQSMRDANLASALKELEGASKALVAKLGADIGKKEFNNSQFGNDNRTMPITVNVPVTVTDTGGIGAKVGAAASSGTKSAVGQIKGSNASTSGVTKP